MASDDIADSMFCVPVTNNGVKNYTVEHIFLGMGYCDNNIYPNSLPYFKRPPLDSKNWPNMFLCKIEQKSLKI